MPAKNLGEKQSVREPRPTRRGFLFCGPALRAMVPSAGPGLAL